MKYYCEICGKEISSQSWIISPRCVECLEKLVEEYDEKVAKLKLKEKLNNIGNTKNG